MNEDEKQQELMFKLSVFEQHIRQLQQQIQAVEQAIVDMNSLNFGLDELQGKKDKEIFAPIGRGIFAKTKLISEDLLVDVGGKNFVKKTIPEAKEMISKQVEKLEEAKKELEQNLEQVGKELERVYGGG
jgi:prefoldin alpha subunit